MRREMNRRKRPPRPSVGMLGIARLPWLSARKARKAERLGKLVRISGRGRVLWFPFFRRSRRILFNVLLAAGAA